MRKTKSCLLFSSTVLALLTSAALQQASAEDSPVKVKTSLKGQFVYEDNDDLAEKRYSGYISFRLNSLREEGKSEIPIVFKGKDLYDSDFETDDLIYSY